MPGVESRDFDSPDETRTPDKTQVPVVRMGVTTAARMTFEPGWRWSECVKPVAGTDSCQARHVGVVHSGRLTRTTRRWTLHLPARWPWRNAFAEALSRIRALAPVD